MFTCCRDETVRLSHLNQYPDELHILLTETKLDNSRKRVFTQQTQNFHNSIQAYNNIVALTSLEANIDHAITNNKHGIYVFQVRGELYHRMGGLLLQDRQQIQYAQVWMYDGDETIQAQMNNL